MRNHRSCVEVVGLFVCIRTWLNCCTFTSLYYNSHHDVLRAVRFCIILLKCHCGLPVWVHQNCIQSKGVCDQPIVNSTCFYFPVILLIANMKLGCQMLKCYLFLPLVIVLYRKMNEFAHKFTTHLGQFNFISYNHSTCPSMLRSWLLPRNTTCLRWCEQK